MARSIAERGLKERKGVTETTTAMEVSGSTGQRTDKVAITAPSDDTTVVRDTM
jgi:hypothetical protein